MEEDYISVERSPTLPVFEFAKNPRVSLRRSYRTYVRARCPLNPSLINLYDFLSEAKAPTYQRICSIDFRCGANEPIVRPDIDLKQLEVEIGREPGGDDKCQSGDGRKGKSLQGRIIIVEDLSKDVVELLGTMLDIDPLFFALHLHTIQRTSSRHQTPDEATLPSRIQSQDFINVSYHRTVTSDSEVPYAGKFLRDTTINRKLVFLRSTSIGLAQHCASVIRIKNRKSPWLGMAGTRFRETVY